MSDEDPDRLALEYLRAPAGTFWRWAADGEAIEFRDGRTIAFGEELLAVLERLAPRGLPSFGAVVLLLAACRPEFGDQTSEWFEVLRGLAERAVEEAGRPRFAWLEGVIDQLGRIRNLPPELRQGARARSVLAEAAFDFRPRGDRERATAIVAALRAGLPPDALARTRVAGALGGFRGDLYELVAGLAELDEDGLRLRACTGLDRLPEPVPQPEELVLPAAVRELLRVLRDDPELGGLAALASALTAVLRLTRPQAQPQQLPLGGVADISNRGRLDQLLVSELAHDPQTLAVRVALGEALYLRREFPPADGPVERVLLLDAGIRMWGRARVHAAAVGLALIAGADGRTEVSVHRAAEGEAVPVDLGRRDGLLEHLAALAPDPHPGDALSGLAGQVGDPARTDLVLVTHERALADPEIQPALYAAASRLRLFAVALDGAGGCRLLAVTPSGMRALRTARHDLSRLAPEPWPPGTRPGLPAILGQQPFPLRLPPFDSRLMRRFRPRFFRRLLHVGERLRLVRNEEIGDPRLWGASLRCGTRVFADSRGCVHLVSHLPELPELSLVFHGGTLVAGWTDDGCAYGSRRFLRSGQPLDLWKLEELLERFRAACRVV